MSLSKHQQPDLPQLCSLAIFSQMSLPDRISAHQVCLEWGDRVREVNQSTVQSLAIAVGDFQVEVLERKIHGMEDVFRSPRLLTNSDGSPQFPMHRLTKWNSLRIGDIDQLNLVTLKQITSTFPSIPELIFATSIGKNFTFLTEVLQNDHWRRQLISLKVIFSEYFYTSTILQPLFAVINSLPALKYLQLSGVKLYDLPILAQLKKIKCVYEDSLLNSLKEHAVKNTGELSVEVFDGDREGSCITTLGKLSEQLRSSITYLNFYIVHSKTILYKFSLFPNLSALSWMVKSAALGLLFTAFSRYHRLQRLDLTVNFTDLSPAHQFPLLQAQLLSVKALDLTLTLNSHSQLNWLNLPVTMPNLQAIHLNNVFCQSCRNKGRQVIFQQGIIIVHKCFRDTLQILHQNTDLPLNRLSYNYNNQYHSSAEELLAE